MNYQLAKNILVTGGTGQIGSFLVENLIDKKFNVVVLGRAANNLKEIKHLVSSEKIRFIECDLTNENKIKSISNQLKDIDYLIHLSSDMHLDKTSFDNAHYVVQLELKGIIRLLSHLKQLNGILYSSSTAVYGRPSYIPVNEECITNPINIYGCGKLGAEQYLRLYSEFKSIPLTILRIAGVYGPRNRSKQAIPTFIKKAINNEPIILVSSGNELRDYIFVSDVIEVILKAIKKNNSDVYNIGTGVGCSIYELAKKIIKITDSESSLNLSEQSIEHNVVCDITKAKQKLGFLPKISLEDGLKKEFEWWKRA